MTTFVLLHGGWHGAWCWEQVKPRLREAGTRSTPLRWPAWASGRIYSARASAWTHVRDVVDVLEREDLRDVFLVGHSYGGMVISGAAELAAGRLAHLVFLDAFVPEDGQSLFDLLRPERRDLYLQAAKVHGEGWRVPPPPPQALGITDEVRAALLAGRLTLQPLRTFEQPVRLKDTAASVLPRTYIHCTAGPLVPSFALFAARAQTDTGWRYWELATGHDAMLTAPEDLVGLLLEPCRT